MVSETDNFDNDDQRAADMPDGDFLVDLEGYEGPLDALLQLARDQKVDLTRISILALADQYLSFIQQASHLRLEMAADYLVMAAWLAYLKSRLLLPEPAGDEEPSGAEMAAALRFQLQRLQAMRDAGVRLTARPRLDSEIFRRGEPVPLRVVTHPIYDVSLYDLLKAYGRKRNRAEATSLRIAPPELYSVEDALQRLRKLVGATPGWRALTAFLPSGLRGGLLWRSALASTFTASLELCREGKLKIRQDGTYGQIYLSNNTDQPVTPP